ncbi:hypothetical protein OPW07_10545 [Vibrio europaeus]|uniref:Uncharacterized protein n=1 Tax=Vibrio europaeus TaxID=300876 RepID=A0AAE7AUM1_9VIBR|nr:hypothetical protein [Vibrio europaeus]MDC5810153.1 hypothetical protein [Vibrio europaeus]QJY36245.1 hypothetical protein HOO69_06290 [Vibrio europaeus]QPG35057.1 hypothetical protein IXK98_16385 [Vibrio europaeus]
MTTPELILPMLLNGLAACIGGFGTIGANAVKGLTILDADDPNSAFQKTPSKVGRSAFILFSSLPTFVVGCIYGLIYIGAFQSFYNEAISLAIAISLGVIAGGLVIKLNELSPQQIIELIRKNVR